MSTAAEAAATAKSKEVRDRWLLSAPALLLIALASVGPLLIVLIYSFLAPGAYGDVKWQFSTEAWFNVFLSRDIFDGTISIADAHLSILWRSIKLAVATTAISLIFGFPTAYFIASRPPHIRSVWLFLITIPFWTNMLIRAFAIQEVIRNEGLANTILMKLGVISAPMQMLYTDFAILLGMAYVHLPLMVLPLYASMEKIDFRLVEAGYDLYATRFQVLRRIIIPLVKPGIIAGSILVFIPALSSYVIPRILGGGKNLMIGNLIELQFGQGRNWPLGASLSITLVIIVLAAMLYYVKNAGKSGDGHA
ncbi:MULTISPECIES: ABC transporter permease [Alphaproteobacteria]|uniref:ABC transporter permease n=2 Tax=Alphaproteobacteria TaxID=28211 RepID=A0A512HJ76_9HYPH|nr:MULTISPECIES: ABC transporter permease [Alphaproteobacteria]GEO85497.1 ABC transporter permease [Ciceribacter naphthalenivorans]GLR21481.1 ABC transporter permease [Ciceribacter naphthalenivorans]GLT04337.1 ABC transporter permease [Sphingomonas psychrolutea]